MRVRDSSIKRCKVTLFWVKQQILFVHLRKSHYICKQSNQNMPSVSVYKASAGSGKTFTLAVQYIRLLITIAPQEYLHTLAVTFTNKATAEMKDRILEQLYGIGHALPESEGYLDALRKNLKEEGMEMGDEMIRKRCLQALQYILHDYSRFRIETIDSFFQSVLRNLAHELGLNARLQVDLNDKQILSQAVDNLVDGLGRNTENDVLPWMDNYVKEQIENADGWDVRNKIKELASIIFTENYMRRDEAFRQLINDEQTIQQYRKSMYALRNKANEAMKDVAQALSETIRAYGDNLEKDVTRGSWIGEYCNKMLAEQYDKAEITEKRMQALEEGPAALLKKADKDNQAKIDALAPVCQAMLLTEQQRQQYITLNNTVDLSIKHLNPLRLLNHIEDEVLQISQDSNRFILAKTPILLAKLIDGSDAPFIFEKMGTIFHNVMIDEFQDTSKLQWENFKVLLFESQSTGGQNLLVGDIKQSIYRFRNGDWHILKNIANELRYSKPEEHTLRYNFRSDVNIIRFNNAFFQTSARILDPVDEKGIISEIYDDVEQLWPEGKSEAGHVRIMLQTSKPKKGNEDYETYSWKEIMLDDMCQRIRELHSQGLPYNKMAVLVRNRTFVPDIIDYVQSHIEDAKMISDEGFYLSNSVALNMLIAALRILTFGKQDPVPERFLIKHYLEDILKEETDLVKTATASVQDVLPEAFTKHISEMRQYPLHELCESLYRIFQLDKIAGEDAYVLYFFDELANYIRNGASDLHSFLEFWDTDMKTKAIPACQVNGISIVTIHKSKGLQYHTVFMPFCDEKMDEVRDTQVLWCDTGKKPYNTMGSLPINGTKKKFESSEYFEDYHAEQLQRRIEELNALYVAFTRPEHNLYVWGSSVQTELTYSALLGEVLSNQIPGMMEKQEGNTWAVWQLGECVTPDSESTVVKKVKEKKKSENRLSPDYIDQDIRFCSHNRRMDFRQSNEASQYIHQQGDDIEEEIRTADGLTYIEQGKLLHDIFSHIKQSSEIERVLQGYVDRGILTNENQTTRIKKLLDKALQHPQAKEWFDGSWDVVNECEIVHLDEDGKSVTHRPDRVMLSDNEIVVVDFKFGKPNPDKYIPQVQGYMQLLQDMYPNHTVKGYLWYVYRNDIETVDFSS